MVGTSLRWPVGGEGQAGLCWLCGLDVGELEDTKAAFVLVLQKRLSGFIQVHDNVRKKSHFHGWVLPDMNGHGLADGCCWGHCSFGVEVSQFALGQLGGLICGELGCCFSLRMPVLGHHSWCCGHHHGCSKSPQCDGEGCRSLENLCWAGCCSRSRVQIPQRGRHGCDWKESWTFLVKTGRKSWRRWEGQQSVRVWRGPPHPPFNTLIQYFGASDPGGAG